MCREIRRVEKVALAVQGQDKGSLFCEKCFTVVPQGSDFCPNCGAPLSHAPGAEGSDAAVYPRLAQANLMRMRKQFKEAEDVCLAILHQYPHNLSANTLMGDISLEEGNLEQAAEWYEMSLDIDRDSASLKEKLQSLRDRQTSDAAQTTAAQLGLPVRKPPTALIGIVIVVFIATVAIAAGYLVTHPSAGAGKASEKAINQPVVIPPTPQPPKNEDASVPALSEDDQQLFQMLKGSAADRDYLTGALYDVPTDGVVLTYNVPDDNNERKIGCSLASESFGLIKDNLNRDISQVELRAVRDKKLFYSAIVRKQDYEDTQSPDWQNAHKGDQDAVLKKILTNEKYLQAEANTNGGAGAGQSESSPAQEGTAQPPTTGGAPGATPPQPTTTGSGAAGTAGASTG